MQLTALVTLIVSIFVLYLGYFLTNRISFLQKYNIPAPVSGGFLCSLVVAMILALNGPKIEFDLQIRNTFLLVFFATVGLTARAKLLLSGGRTFLILVGLTVVFLVCQNVSGILGAWVTGLNPGFGLLGGTISFAGGHGTAVTWGTLAEEFGLSGATDFGLAAATFGLIAGGAIGGPIAHRLIDKFHLQGDPTQESYTPGAESLSKHGPVNTNGMIDGILLIALCVGGGLAIHEGLKTGNIIVPEFLPVLFVGVILTNFIDLFKIKIHANAIGLLSDVSLQIYLAISLMSMQLSSLEGVLGPLLVILLLQVFTMAFFARFLIFPLCGKDYDAAVMSAGFAGLGLGATPVGVANMRAVTSKFGASPKAFFIIPLIGAFILDIANALILQGFLKLPIFH